MRIAPLVVLLPWLLAGCCRDAGACPQNAVVVHVTRGGAAVDGVTVEGASTPWTCRVLESETLCAPTSIANGSYDVLVGAQGEPDATLSLTVRTVPAPPYSCDCELPRGEVFLELDPGSNEPDAGATDDAAAALDGG